MLGLILLISVLVWWVASWEWRVPQGLERRILEFQAKLSAPVRMFHRPWAGEESPEDVLRRIPKELAAAERAMEVPLFLVIELAQGPEQTYINPQALIERRFQALVQLKAEP